MSTLINGFTDPTTGGQGFAWEINATRDLLNACPRAKLPVFYTTVTAYAEDMHDAGVFAKKVPSLAILQYGSPMIEVDARIKPLAGGTKKYATLSLVRASTSTCGCSASTASSWRAARPAAAVRASAVELAAIRLSNQVVREAVGNCAPGPHEANLFDIDAKYGDVVELADALDYLRSFTGDADFAAQAQQDFDRWWPRAQRG